MVYALIALAPPTHQLLICFVGFFQFDLLPLLERMVPTHVMVLELDGSGQVVRSLHDSNAEVTGPVSTILDMGDKLLLGSYFAPYLVVVPLDT